MSLYDERLKRIKAAVALEPVDKIPLIPCGTSYYAKVCGVKIADYLKNIRYNCTVNIKGTELFGGVDAVQNTIFAPDALSLLWFSEVRVPGRNPEMSDNEIWQVVEKETVKREDYDSILKDGYNKWLNRFLKERLGDPMKKSLPLFLYLKRSIQRFKKAGYPCINMGALATPFEMFCGGRSMDNFFCDDLVDEPDLVEQVFKVTQAACIKNYTKQLDFIRPIGVWIGGWRGTPSMLSPEMFDRFCWPYMEELANLCISKNVIPVFHLDSCWDRGLVYFKRLPKGKCIMALDGITNIRKAKEIVGDRMCIMGDVPASLLAYGSEEEVYDYCRALIRDIGPTGFILSSGCDVPFNAKPENVRMMGKACEQ